MQSLQGYQKPPKRPPILQFHFPSSLDYRPATVPVEFIHNKLTNLVKQLSSLNHAISCQGGGGDMTHNQAVMNVDTKRIVRVIPVKNTLRKGVLVQHHMVLLGNIHTN